MILISISFVALYGIVNHQFFTPKIAYVDTSKLMVAFSDAAKVEKWFKRNCGDVLNRACTALEKGDFLTYVLSVRK